MVHKIYSASLILCLFFSCDSSSPSSGSEQRFDTGMPDQQVLSPDVPLPADAGVDRPRTDVLTTDHSPAEQKIDGTVQDTGPLMEFSVQVPNTPAGYLCDIPEDYMEKGGDPVNPPCVVEADSFSDRDPNTVSSPLILRVVSWNIEFGKKTAELKTALGTEVELQGVDVFLLQEVPRNDGESVPPWTNLSRELAQQLKMNYVFSVEWDRRLNDGQKGEHGTAILSKYPIGNVTQIRHKPLFDFFTWRKTYGGRASLGADLLIGTQRIRIYSAHLCTNDPTGSGRATQGAEVRADAAKPGQPPIQIVGGDFNTFLCNPLVMTCNAPPQAEKVIQEFLQDHWIDLLPTFNSWTELGAGLFPQRLDWLFGKKVTHLRHAVLQNVRPSDHVPVVTVVSIP